MLNFRGVLSIFSVPVVRGSDGRVHTLASLYPINSHAWHWLGYRKVFRCELPR